MFTLLMALGICCSIMGFMCARSCAINCSFQLLAAAFFGVAQHTALEGSFDKALALVGVGLTVALALTALFKKM